MVSGEAKRLIVVRRFSSPRAMRSRQSSPQAPFGSSFGSATGSAGAAACGSATTGSATGSAAGSAAGAGFGSTTASVIGVPLCLLLEGFGRRRNEPGNLEPDVALAFVHVGGAVIVRIRADPVQAARLVDDPLQ